MLYCYISNTILSDQHPSRPFANESAFQELVKHNNNNNNIKNNNNNNNKYLQICFTLHIES